MPDPITKLFMNRQPSMKEVSSGLWQSLASHKVSKPGSGVSFGETLNNIRGAKIKEAMQFEGVKQSRKKLDLQEKTFDLNKEKVQYGKEKVQNEVYDKATKHIEKIYGADAAVRIHVKARDSANPIGGGSLEQTTNELVGIAEENGIRPTHKPDDIRMKQLDVPTGEVGPDGQPTFRKTWYNMRDPADIRRLKADGATDPETTRGQNTRMQHLGPYVSAEGEYLGEAVFSRLTGGVTMTDGSPLPPGAQPRTEGSLAKNVFSGPDFAKLASTASEEERSLRALQKYMKNVASTDQGLSLIADQLYGQFSTIFGSELKPEEYRTLIQEGQLQRLLGGFRKEIVGGGVMTEYDAQRVLMALGGDVSLLRNKEVAVALISDLMSEKAREYNDVTVPLYNAQLKATRRGKFNPKESIKISDLFTEGAAKDAPEKDTSEKDLDEIMKKYGQ